MSRYDPLTTHLQMQSAAQVRMSFAEIEAVLGRSLPDSAVTHRGWWSNNPSNNVMTRAWLDAGFRSEQVDLAGRTLVFRRVADQAPRPGFAEARIPLKDADPDNVGPPALFGWLNGTVMTAPGVDIGAPADPEWADVAAPP